MAEQKNIGELVLAAAVAVCGQPPKTIAPDDYRKILASLKKSRIKRERVNYHLRVSGYKRTEPYSRNKKVQAIVAAGFKAVQKLENPAEIDALKAKLTADVAEALKDSGQKPPEWNSLCKLARLMELPGWPNIRSALKDAAAASKPSEPVTDEQIADFMTRGRSASEVARKFMLTPEEAAAKLAKGFEKYDLVPGPKNLREEQTYVAVPKVGSNKVPSRAWSHLRESKEGQPYIVVKIPNDFDHKKIRVLPLDGIRYGHPSHDAVRFKSTVSYIARDPNSFCFLNGDVIDEVKGGKREEKDAVLIERSVEFERLLRPIAHKILWAQQGCLEARSFKQQGFDPLQHICEKYGIPYFTEPVYADVVWKSNIFTFWAMHGQSAPQVKGAKINTLIRPSRVLGFTQFIIRGHIGDAMWNRAIKICRNPMKRTIDAKEEFHIILGNFVKFFGTEAARKGIAPSSKEVIALYLYPNGDHHLKTRDGGKS